MMDNMVQPFATFEACKEAIAAFCERWEDRIPGVHPGFDWAHIVIEDYNLERDSIAFVLTQLPAWLHDLLTVDQPAMIGEQRADLLAYLSEEIALLSRIHRSDTADWF